MTTKQELIDAYCEAVGYEGDDKVSFIQEEKTRIATELSEKFNIKSVEQMKRIAIRHIQLKLGKDLKDVTL